MLSLNLTPIFTARAIERPFTFLVKAGFTPHTAHKIITNTTKSFTFNHIELLCKILICEPNDLLLFTPNKDSHYPPDHPLLKLQQQQSLQNMKETFATIPYQQLKQITKQINKVD